MFSNQKWFFDSTTIIASVQCNRTTADVGRCLLLQTPVLVVTREVREGTNFHLVANDRASAKFWPIGVTHAEDGRLPEKDYK